MNLCGKDMIHLLPACSGSGHVKSVAAVWHEAVPGIKAFAVKSEASLIECEFHCIVVALMLRRCFARLSFDLVFQSWHVLELDLVRASDVDRIEKSSER